MKLLFDQHLGFKLYLALANICPSCSRIRLLGLAEADDRTVWQLAKANGFVLVTQDSEDYAAVGGALSRFGKRLGQDAGLRRALGRVQGTIVNC